MLFNSIEFLFFLPVVILTYFLVPTKLRWILLLAASYFFYMSWKVEYLVLIVISTLIDFYMGILMEKQREKKSKLIYLALSLFSNLGLLFFFKYFNFFATNINEFFIQNEANHIPLMKLLLPVGISFYTFQTLSYSIDVYNGKIKAERHLGYFALYVSFFPQLVAGPIERFSRLTPQLKINQHFNYENLAKGFRLILYGFFVKMVVADNLANYVDTVYESPEAYALNDLLTGVFFYSFQIYCDFYGYSLIAIGSAQLIGIQLMDNFKTPYLSKSIAEFWQRWHISLSRWFRDYLYFPLGGNRVKKLQWFGNILTVFVVSGIWHGANWTFVIWGALYGILYLIENISNSYFKVLHIYQNQLFVKFLLVLKTFTLVSFIWVFFRSQTVHEALNMFQLLFASNHHQPSEFLNVPNLLWILLILFLISDLILYNKRFDISVGQLPLIPRWLLYGLLVFSVIAFAGVDDFPFIYFQF